MKRLGRRIAEGNGRVARERLSGAGAMAKLKHRRGSSGVFGLEGAPILVLDARIAAVAMTCKKSVVRRFAQSDQSAIARRLFLPFINLVGS